ncbi:MULTISPECIES: NAD(+) kinase [Halomonas]|uniref:NAD kinase n=3 Tax=Halomonas TaxID=2745 RepID=A0AAU7KDL7_9GAMM|nr:MULTISPECIES: NAD(+) kinase [Halomonas]MBR9770122.1 NAD(+) kinase [Gammaproteobacteria bacterium]KJZ07056.1 inorganic polyphosphate kinase [Halomonas sp. S2151]MAR73270.1 NAD(+) kinase [Halomonas sp.]MAY72273.1 NAD(+) kinase [Halomonas sp.]MBR9881011.1 NAD(+) kinase [Gammaproteobacteria bacterium]|tara:strand:+ start:503 stop:1384 length:882 start_codon:yes stop_codon:yes gene_type:complete
MQSFKNIGLIGRLGSAKVVETLKRLIRFLDDAGYHVIVEDRTASALLERGHAEASRRMLGELCDLVIVVGGDGSLLGAARTLCRSGTLVLGVNRGRLGFLTDISPDELEARVGEVLAGQYEVEQRFLLDAELYRGDSLVGSGDALNEVVLHPGKAVRMIEFELFIDGQFVYSQRSDGLIIATPTGSTAYAMSGGGPIMHPKLDVVTLVPMFPHTLSSRPIVIDAGCEIRCHIGETNQTYPHISCDGQTRAVAKPDDVLVIRRKPQNVQLVHPLGHNFYDVLRSKLGWSNRLGD